MAGAATYGYRQPSYSFFGMPWDDDYRPRRPGGGVRSGGERPAVDRLEPRTVSFPSSYAVGSIVIDTKGRQLFLVQSPTEALRYPISVGREGFSWTGAQTISRKAEWPDWHPPEEMRWRDPRLPEKMTGGVKNPLGAMALYLGDSLYRIHGTNDATSIGRAASSGCFRMLNGHIVDLAARVGYRHHRAGGAPPAAGAGEGGGRPGGAAEPAQAGSARRAYAALAAVLIRPTELASCHPGTCSRDQISTGAGASGWLVPVTSTGMTVADWWCDGDPSVRALA